MVAESFSNTHGRRLPLSYALIAPSWVVLFSGEPISPLLRRSTHTGHHHHPSLATALFGNSLRHSFSLTTDLFGDSLLQSFSLATALSGDPMLRRCCFLSTPGTFNSAQNSSEG